MIYFSPKRILVFLLTFLVSVILVCALHGCVNDSTPKTVNTQSVPELKLVATGPHYISLYEYTDSQGNKALIVYSDQMAAVSITKFR